MLKVVLTYPHQIFHFFFFFPDFTSFTPPHNNKPPLLETITTTWNKTSTTPQTPVTVTSSLENHLHQTSTIIREPLSSENNHTTTITSWNKISTTPPLPFGNHQPSLPYTNNHPLISTARLTQPSSRNHPLTAIRPQFRSSPSHHRILYLHHHHRNFCPNSPIETPKPFPSSIHH